MRTKSKRTQTPNAAAFTMAVAIGVANAIALQDIAVGFGISICIFGIIFLGQTLNYRAKNKGASS